LGFVYLLWEWRAIATGAEKPLVAAEKERKEEAHEEFGLVNLFFLLISLMNPSLRFFNEIFRKNKLPRLVISSVLQRSGKSPKVGPC